MNKKELKKELLFLCHEKIENLKEFIKELNKDFYDTKELKEIYENWL